MGEYKYYDMEQVIEAALSMCKTVPGLILDGEKEMYEPSVKKNYVYRLFYEILAVITPFITAPYVSRVLGADGIGIYSYTSSIMTYFTLFAALGTATYGAREIAQHRDNKIETSKLFWEIELMTVGTSLVCLIVWGFVILFSKEYRWYYIALVPTLLGTMFDVSWFFTGLEQIKYIVLRNTICKFLGIVLLFLLVHEKQDLIIYVLINSGISLFGSLSMWSYLPKILKKIDFKTLTFKKHFNETLVYFIPTIATSVYTILDKTLIGAITNSTYENGYYEQATKIINIMKSVVFSALNAVMGSRISYLFAKKKIIEIKKRLIRSIDFIFLLGYGCVFGIIAVAHNFVPIFFGEGFEPVILLLSVMAPIIIIIGTSNCLGSQYFNPSGQRARSAKVSIGGSFVNIVLNLILIPQFGALGATIASVIAELVITVFYVRMSDGYMTVKTLWKCSQLRILAGVIMMVTVICVGKLQFAPALSVLIIQVGGGVVIYGLVLLLLRDKMAIELVNMMGDTMKKITKRG